ncbi:MAG TPA: SDR family oxidoreductase [Acidimicrobiales bacterium]|nr:SDR family oxidoreductase [Acidimicrobiales bacterium]
MSPVALVTGASRGIGRATAIALAEKGFDVALAARTVHEGDGRDDARPGSAPLPGSLEATASAVEALGVRALPVRMDLHERESLTAGAATVLDVWGHIDVLVNNAVDTGPGSMTTVADTTLDDYQRKLEGNFLAQLVLIHAVLPHLLERGEGTIVDITSAAGITDPPAPAGEGGWGLAYAASKAAFHRVAAHLAVEFGPRGVLAFNVEPGMVMTEKMAVNQKAMGLENRFPVAPPSVPAAVVAWLCTDPEAADHNGETFTAQRFAKDRGLHQPWW